MRKVILVFMVGLFAFSVYGQKSLMWKSMKNATGKEVMGVFRNRGWRPPSAIAPSTSHVSTPKLPLLRIDTLQTKPQLLRPIRYQKLNSLLPTFQDSQKLYDKGCEFFQQGDTVMAVGLFQMAAMKGLTEAQFTYGMHVLQHAKSITEYTQGWKWVRKAALQEHTIAQYLLGANYYYNNGVFMPQDSISGFQWIKKAADNGHFMAQLSIGDIYQQDRADTANAVRYYTMADENARRDSDFIMACNYQPCIAQADYLLGYFHYNGNGTPRDLNAAVKYWEQASKWGHTGARYELTLHYSQLGDNDSTILWGCMLGSRDSLAVQCCVGNAYYAKGDFERAAYWWRKAAAQNYVDACWALATLYENDLKDSVASFTYIQQAASLGHPVAINDLGTHYLLGEMVGKDIAKARDCFMQSAEAGCGEAYCNLGLIHYHKEYKMKNRPLAAEYWKCGAELGSPECQYNYGAVLMRGHGVKKDEEQGLRWITLAAENGSMDAKEFLLNKK